MDHVDIGHPSAAVFVDLEWDPASGWRALFVSRFGDSYALDRGEIHLRIRYLDAHGMDSVEERKALSRLDEQIPG